jgi:hypothetical protein
MKYFLFMILAGHVAFAQETKTLSVERAYSDAFSSQKDLNDRLISMALLINISHSLKISKDYNERPIQVEVLNELSKGSGLYLSWAQSKAVFDIISKVAATSDLDITLAMGTLFPQLNSMIRNSVDELYFIQEGRNDPNLLTSEELKNFFEAVYPKLNTKDKVKLLRSVFTVNKRVVSNLFSEIAKTIRIQTEAEIFLDILSQGVEAASLSEKTLLINEYLEMVGSPANKDLFKSQDALDIRRKIASKIKSTMPTLRKTVHQDYFWNIERKLAQELDSIAKRKPVIQKNKPLPLYKRILNYFFPKEVFTCAQLFG